jgi:alkylated DNA repair dioxygenase AlkB
MVSASRWPSATLPAAEEPRPKLLLRVAKDWAGARDGGRWFDELARDVPWKDESVTVFGRRHALPRRTCWMADTGCGYRYSDLENVIEPWSRAASEIRERVSAACGVEFNSVLLNLYRDGRDSMGWHSDDERELDPRACIASLSLGAARTFRFRARHDATQTFSLELEHGDLLAMEPPTQAHWQHALPRRLRIHGPRLNLTFRRVLPRGELR